MCLADFVYFYVMLSSLRRKQPKYPVLFLTTNLIPEYGVPFDVRTQTIYDAMMFTRTEKLLVSVTFGKWCNNYILCGCLCATYWAYFSSAERVLLAVQLLSWFCVGFFGCSTFSLWCHALFLYIYNTNAITAVNLSSASVLYVLVRGRQLSWFSLSLSLSRVWTWTPLNFWLSPNLWRRWRRGTWCCSPGARTTTVSLTYSCRETGAWQQSSMIGELCECMWPIYDEYYCYPLTFSIQYQHVDPTSEDCLSVGGRGRESKGAPTLAGEIEKNVLRAEGQSVTYSVYKYQTMSLLSCWCDVIVCIHHYNIFFFSLFWFSAQVW